jgi:hypothetical protein
MGTHEETRGSGPSGLPALNIGHTQTDRQTHTHNHAHKQCGSNYTALKKAKTEVMIFMPRDTVASATPCASQFPPDCVHAVEVYSFKAALKVAPGVTPSGWWWVI